MRFGTLLDNHMTIDQSSTLSHILPTMTSTQIEPKFTKTDPLEHYASYPFDTDQVYQVGTLSHP